MEGMAALHLKMAGQMERRMAMGLYGSDAESVLNGWRDRWASGVEEIQRQLEHLAAATIDELDGAYTDLSDAVDSLAGDIPCEDGIAEFVRDEMNGVSEEDVLIGIESSEADIREAGFIRIDAVQEALQALRVLSDLVN
jgi:hypothetical protein